VTQGKRDSRFDRIDFRIYEDMWQHYNDMLSADILITEVKLHKRAGSDLAVARAVTHGCISTVTQACISTVIKV